MMATIALVSLCALGPGAAPGALLAMTQDAPDDDHGAPGNAPPEPPGDPAELGADDLGQQLKPDGVEPPLEEGPDVHRRLTDDAQRTQPVTGEPMDALSAWDLVHIVLQTALIGAAGWIVAAPMAAAAVLAAGGIIPGGLSFLVLVPAAPLLLLFPPVAVAGAAALAGWGRLSLLGVAAVAGIGGAASMAAAFVIGPFVLLRLFSPPPPSEAYNPGIYFRATWTIAAIAIWTIPALAGGLAAGVAAPFFLKGPEEGEAEGEGAQDG